MVEGWWWYFQKRVHPPARKILAGQKIILGSDDWWIVSQHVRYRFDVPITTTMFADTFSLLNVLGFNLPTDLTALREQQLNQLWHGIVSFALMTMIIAHIYIGSVGMEGAIDAMNSGHVDRNWAKEHHNLWVEEDQKVNPKPAE